MQPNSIKLLTDAHMACDKIGRWVAGADYATYKADEYMQSAVERQFEIVGEALRRLDRSDPGTAGQIGELRRIIGFRNHLAHAYDDVDHILVFQIATVHIPALRIELARLLDLN